MKSGTAEKHRTVVYTELIKSPSPKDTMRMYERTSWRVAEVFLGDRTNIT